PRALEGRRGRPGTATEADPAGKLAGQALHLGAHRTRPGGFGCRRRLVELLLELAETRSVRDARLRIEQRAGVADVDDRRIARPDVHDADELHGEKLFAWVTEQLRQVRDAEAVTQAEHAAVEPDGPVLALAAEERLSGGGGLRGAGCRRGRR